MYLPQFAMRRQDDDISHLLNQVHCCDAMALLRRLPDASVDATVTDIPYGEVNRASSGIRVLDKGTADIVTFDIELLANELARVSKQWVYVFCGIEQVSILRSIFRQYGMSRLIVWKKTNPTPLNCEYIWLSDIECCVVLRKSGGTFNQFYKSSVIEFEAGSSKEHPTQKPIGIMQYLIESSSSVDNIICDPFCGSGTTAIAARKTGRQFICGDNHLPYVELARKRLADTDPYVATELPDGSKQLSLFEGKGA